MPVKSLENPFWPDKIDQVLSFLQMNDMQNNNKKNTQKGQSLSTPAEVLLFLNVSAKIPLPSSNSFLFILARSQSLVLDTLSFSLPSKNESSNFLFWGGVTDEN